MLTNELIAFADKANDTEKATYIEAIEFAIKQNSNIADENVFAFVANALTQEAPRLKWDSAKVIGKIAALFPTKLNTAISNLLTNTEHKGTIVRWASAFALGEILKLRTKHNRDLLQAIETIYGREQGQRNKEKIS